MTQQFHSHKFEEDEDTKKRYMLPTFIADLFTITKVWKQIKHPSIYEWIKKTMCLCDCIHKHTQQDITHSQKQMKFCYLQQCEWT